MAFLDNSGDIILDAVLTETGRRKMANGNFSITKFALGDDEIDYSLYDKNHPSGSAYYDLEILQTPIFEAFTQVNAGINYGLLATSATDLLYLPVMETNALSGLNENNIATYEGMYYAQDTGGDTGNTKATNIAKALTNTGIVNMQGREISTSNYVLLETGLNTGFGSLPVGTQANKRNYLTANGLIDRTYYVFYDNRFISGILGLTAASTFTNSGESNSYNGSLSVARGGSVSLSIGLDNYSTYRLVGVENQIFYYNDNDTAATYSVIGGPRGSVCAVAPIIKEGLDAEYTLYGTTASGLLAASGGPSSVKYIDTTIYVQGATTGAQAQLPIRIIRIS